MELSNFTIPMEELIILFFRCLLPLINKWDKTANSLGSKFLLYMSKLTQSTRQ